MREMVILLLAAAVLTGCAGNLPKSEARRVAEAGGLDVRDVPAALQHRAVPGKVSATPEAVMAAGTAAKYFEPPPGVSRGSATGLLAAGAFVGWVSTPSERLSRVIAWMPKDQAHSRSEAAQRLSSLLRHAVAQAMPMDQVKPLPSPHAFLVGIDGPNCSETCRFGVGQIDTPAVGSAPEFLGGYQSYAWVSSDWGYRAWWRSGYPNNRADLSTQQKLDFYRRVSSHLPAWVYLYIAPSKEVASYPVVYHQGKALLFVQPNEGHVVERTASAD